MDTDQTTCKPGPTCYMKPDWGCHLTPLPFDKVNNVNFGLRICRLLAARHSKVCSLLLLVSLVLNE